MEKPKTEKTKKKDKRLGKRVSSQGQVKKKRRTLVEN
jgi:hypothetical protein